MQEPVSNTDQTPPAVRNAWLPVTSRPGRVAACAVLIPIIILAVIWFRGNESQFTGDLSQKPYTSDPPSLAGRASSAWVIPGLNEGAIPQGLTYLPEQDRVLISHYLNGGPTLISIVDNASGEMVGAVRLKETPETDHTGHGGGIAIVADCVYLASDDRIRTYPLSSFISVVPENSIVELDSWECETRADFATATNRMLFVGEFSFGTAFPTDDSHHLINREGAVHKAWACGYDLTSNAPSKSPKFILSVPDCVQGMHVTEEKIFLSTSFGRRYDSRIMIYHNPLNETAHARATARDGSHLPVWFLDNQNLVEVISLPPMAEGITMIDNQLAVLTESAASKYRWFGKLPIDRLLLVQIDGKTDEQ